MAITWGGTEITDYLQSIGIPHDKADDIEDYVQQMTTQFPIVERDSSLVNLFTNKHKDILFINEQTYELNLYGSESDIEAWILANRADLADLAAFYADIVWGAVYDISYTGEQESDANAPNDQVGYWKTDKQMYVEQAALNFSRIVYYMRHFALIDHPELPGQSERVWTE